MIAIWAIFGIIKFKEIRACKFICLGYFYINRGHKFSYSKSMVNCSVYPSFLDWILLSQVVLGEIALFKKYIYIFFKTFY